MSKILITGGNGQLGQSIQSLLSQFPNNEYTFTDVEDLDICNEEDVNNYFTNHYFDYVINCAAYTAVDKAESDKVIAKKLNAEAVKNLAIASAKSNTKLIQVSTDYVFDGKAFKPYSEDQFALPESVYGETKLLGEKLALENNPNTIIIRTSWLYSEFGNNFVKTMIRLGQDRDELNVVADQVGTPTYAVDLAETILTIIEKLDNNKAFVPGVFHYSNEGVCSWYDFTINIHQLVGVDCKVGPIESKDYPTAAPRPFYSVLNKSKIKNTYQIKVPYWKSSLEKCLRKLV